MAKKKATVKKRSPMKSRRRVEAVATKTELIVRKPTAKKVSKKAGKKRWS